jgi:hypothetical protein
MVVMTGAPSSLQLQTATPLKNTLKEELTPGAGGGRGGGGGLVTGTVVTGAAVGVATVVHPGGHGPRVVSRGHGDPVVCVPVHVSTDAVGAVVGDEPSATKPCVTRGAFSERVRETAWRTLASRRHFAGGRRVEHTQRPPGARIASFSLTAEEENVMPSEALRWNCVMEQHGLTKAESLEPKPGSCAMSAFQQ